MKTREEQIAEMAKEMRNYGYKHLCGGRVFYYGFCEKLYDAGYRKQSDTVREFVKRVKEIYDKSDRLYRDYDIISLWSDIIRLAVEYGALAQDEEGYVEKVELEE